MMALRPCGCKGWEEFQSFSFASLSALLILGGFLELLSAAPTFFPPDRISPILPFPP